MSIKDEHAIWIPSPNYSEGRMGYKPTHIICHGTAGGTSAQAIATNVFGSVNNPVSSHYVIGQDGTVVQCVAEDDWAWANAPAKGNAAPYWFKQNPNLITISIEHCKPDDQNATPLTTAQQVASFALIHRIAARWNIPIKPADESGGVTGHYAINPIDRPNCPGVFPWDELWKSVPTEEVPTVIDLNTPGVSNYFEQAPGNVWHCKTPHHDYVIGGGILEFYRSFCGNALCGITYLGLPDSGEEAVVGHPGVVTQRFERAIVCYDPTRSADSPPGAIGSVYLAHIDQSPQQPTSQPDALKQSLLTTMHNIFLAASAYEGKK